MESFHSIISIGSRISGMHFEIGPKGPPQRSAMFRLNEAECLENVRLVDLTRSPFPTAKGGEKEGKSSKMIPYDSYVTGLVPFSIHN